MNMVPLATFSFHRNAHRFFFPNCPVSVLHDMMNNTLRFCKGNSQTSFIPIHYYNLQNTIKGPIGINSAPRSRRKYWSIECSGTGENKKERRSFLSLEEAGLVEVSGLDSHEGFLCRLTVCFC